MQPADRYISSVSHPVVDAAGAFQALCSARVARSLVLLVGSAISGFHPSCHPPGRSFSDQLPRFLSPEKPLLLKQFQRVPFEILLCHGASAIGRARIIAFLQRLFHEGRPNAIHSSLARLLRSCRAIITPNFDNLIEGAFLGANFRSADLSQKFAERGALRFLAPGSNTDLRVLEESLSAGTPVLFKIHGSIEHPETLIFDINQEGQLDRWKTAALRRVLMGAHLLVLGYSGSDWDIVPTIQQIARGMDGLTWNELKLSNLNLQVRVFLRETQATVLEGDMNDVLAGLDPEHRRPQRCDHGIERIGRALEGLGSEDRQHWYAAVLARCGYGEVALDLLRSLKSKTYAVFLHLAEAAFVAGRYKDCRQHAVAASCLAENLSERVNARLIECNALRQQGAHLKQLRVLRRLLRISDHDSQEFASALAYIAQNPLVPRNRRIRYAERAQTIRGAQPWSSMLLLTSVIRTGLRLGGESPSGSFHTSVEDLLVYSKRLAHATEIVNSYRDISLERLEAYHCTGRSGDLVEARWCIMRSLVVARRCHDVPGCAKGLLILAEIGRQAGDRCWPREWLQAMRLWWRIQIPRANLPWRLLGWHVRVALWTRAWK